MIKKILFGLILFLILSKLISQIRIDDKNIPNENELVNTVIKRDTLIRVEANPENGFNFAYFIFIPSKTEFNTTLLIQPNNTGYPNDTLTIHEDDAQKVASNKYYLGNYTSRKLGIPLLIPAFPRPKSEWRIYTHALDRDAIIAKGEIERIDLQLISMINDAELQLFKFGIHIDQKVFLTGFSASATFINRFALIHPEIIKGYAVGGVNGIVMLPTDRIKGEELPYPIGISDFEVLFKKNFNLNEFAQIPQYIFMGENDNNDAVDYDDAYEDSERSKIHLLLGINMMPERWENCQKIYETCSINAVFKTYPNIGHKKYEIIKDDVVSFFSTILNNN
jgi:hypothetical protein